MLLTTYPTELFPEFPDTLRPPSSEQLALEAPLSQVSPGVWVSGLPAFDVPTHVLCRMVPVLGEPGHFTFDPQGAYPGYVRITDDIGKRLGIIGLNVTTLRRLLWGGFIDHIRPHPGGIYISIESLLAHFKRTANDCAEEHSYWTQARRDAWRVTCEGVGNRED
jgi:hypothetical protein